MMKLLIQYNMLEESRLQAIKDAVQHLPHEFVGMIPFSREITHNDGVDLSGTDFIPYGSTLLTTQGSKNHNWKGAVLRLSQVQLR